MNILGTLLGSVQGGAVGQAAAQLGLGSSDSEALLKKLVPALAGGIQRSAANAGGLEGLAAALGKGNHQRYIDDPAALKDAATVMDGNAILGHLLGSKEVSRRVAGEASAETGIDVGTIKKFLPIVAAAAMGALSKQTQGGASLSKSDLGGALGMLSSLLGSAAGDSTAGKLLSLGKKLF
jgi:hypothetical protein